MPIIIEGEINEGSSGWIDVVGQDVDGDAVTPTTMYWWWSDSGGNIVNSRNKVEVAGGALGATTVTIDGVSYAGTAIELTPTDTTLNTQSDTLRLITVKYVYDSDRGSDKTNTESGEVEIKALRMVPLISPSASESPSESPSASPSLSPSASESPSESPSVSPSA